MALRIVHQPYSIAPGAKPISARNSFAPAICGHIRPHAAGRVAAVPTT